MIKNPAVPTVLADGSKIEKAFVVISLVSATSDGSSSDTYELAGVFKTEADAKDADIKGWWGAYPEIHPVIVINSGEDVYILLPRRFSYGKIKSSKRIYLGSENGILKVLNYFDKFSKAARSEGE